MTPETKAQRIVQAKAIELATRFLEQALVRDIFSGGWNLRKRKSSMSREVKPHQRMLRTKQAADYLGITERKLRRLVWEKKLRVFQEGEGRPWLFDMRDLDRYIEQHKTDAPWPASVNGLDLRPQDRFRPNFESKTTTRKNAC